MNADGLRLSRQAGALIARPQGELDLSNAEQVGQRIAEAIPAQSPGAVLDLTAVSFMDSFGIYVMIGLAQRLAARGQTLALVAPEDSPLLSTLHVSNVQAHLPILDRVDDALRRLAAGPPQL
jgi:anti-anti-sigma factor